MGLDTSHRPLYSCLIEPGTGFLRTKNMSSKAKKKNTLFSYLRESKEELEKVAWPTQKQTTRYSIVVIVISLVIAVYFGIIDYLLNPGLEALLSIS